MKPINRFSALALLMACTHIGPYDRGKFKDAPGLRHSGIPLTKGTKFFVRQGAFGSSSHNEKGNEFSWDLEVPWGTPIVAVEEGTVLYVYKPMGADGRGACDKDYANFAWNVQIEHKDRTVAQYVHVDSPLHLGDHVKKGQVIAKNSETGWVCYPHVHFAIYRSRSQLYESVERETLPLYFDGIPEGLLKEGQSYVVP